jgi:ATP-grasp domain
MSLASSGLTVDAVCPSRHSLSKLHSVRRTYTHYGFSPEDSFKTAILSSNPDLVIPCDDLAARHLHKLCTEPVGRKPYTSIHTLIERSLGSPKSFSILYQRAAFIEVAREEGIRTPETRVISDLTGLRTWTNTVGLPTVLKVDSTSGGEGVRIVATMEEAEHVFNTLSTPPLLARAVKRALIDQDSSLLRSSFLRRRSRVSGQSFIRGCEATSVVACWNGTVLASLHFQVINKTDATGHSTVLQLIENADMSKAVERMVRRLGLSGINGFDFMLEAETGSPYLIEINPRATQVGHLTLGSGRDIPAALFSAVTGQPIQEATKITDNKVIALFPQEWKRDPASPYLRSGYHDVPWDEPELIRACVRPHRKQWARYAEQQDVRGLALARASRS